MRVLLVLGICLAPLAFSQDAAVKIKRAPAPSTSAASGSEMFTAYCASCHGSDAKGGGPAAAALKQKPADLTLLAQKNGGKYPVGLLPTTLADVNANVHGSREMPIWGPVFSSVSHNDPMVVKLRIDNISRYIESLQAR